MLNTFILHETDCWFRLWGFDLDMRADDIPHYAKQREWGHSPVWNALAEIKKFQRLQKYNLQIRGQYGRK